MPFLENFSFLPRRWRRIGKIGVAINRSPATAATRFDPRTAGGGAAEGFTRRGSVFTVVGREDKLELDDAWHWQDEKREYGHIMTVLVEQGGFGQNYSDSAFYVRFLALKERRAAHDKFIRKGLNCGEDAYFA